ncbi:hypothetical protein EV361DRAFT_584926 [Lentinula raphanica]|nr:hypothetical protein EV361DRAFT_584926 [Lentinula raphanica]
MNYDYWDSVRLLDMKQKIGHAIALISSIGNSIMEQSPDLHLPNLKQFREHRTSNKIVQGNHAQSSAIHRSRSISQFAVPSAIGWAGPASDALAARLNSKAKHDSPQERHSTTWTAEPRDRKRGSRTNNEGLYLQEHRRRQSEYMLQADEPDDSDDTDSDSGCENGVEQIGCRHGSAPLIPMYTRPPSTATLLDDPTMVMYQWGSSSALFSTKKTEEPRPVTTVESSSCLAPNPTFIPDPRIQPQPHLPVFNSRTWSGVSHALPHHR